MRRGWNRCTTPTRTRVAANSLNLHLLLNLPRSSASPLCSFWVILAITWGLIATVVSTTMPLWEARESLWTSECPAACGRLHGGGHIHPCVIRTGTSSAAAPSSRLIQNPLSQLPLPAVTRNLFTCAAPTPEEETKGEAQPGDFAQQMFPAPSFAEKMDRMDGEKSSP